MMVTITIDNQVVQVPAGTTVLTAADALGVRIPRFCHHPRLSIAGNCRVCLVEVEGCPDPVISCREPAREGMVVRTQTEAIRRARAEMFELILLNHPLDCPVCDAAGECDLQDLYFEHSLKPCRSIEPKVRKQKAVIAGRHVMLDAERCVACSRCVRFCEEVAGVHELGFCERGDRMEIAVAPEGLGNPYSLCTVDLCPVGALTSRSFRFQKRVWMLQSGRTICIGCGRGCNAWLDHAEGRAYRMRPAENEAVNRCWMCDEGRMTCYGINAATRLIRPRILRDHEHQDASWAEALSRLRELVQGHGMREVVVVLSAAASIEENEAFGRLATASFRSSRLVHAGICEEPAFGDAILRTALRSPNAAGVKRIAPQPLGELPERCGVLMLELPSEAELMQLVAGRPAWIAVAASHQEGPLRWADVLLPRATHFEQGGTYVNCDGLSQRAEPVLACAGESLPGVTIAQRIAEVLK